MTLPVELLQRRPPAERYDAVVVGAGIGGLVCAAILARAGARVVLLDRARRPGGQLQTVAHQGFAVDLGPLLWEAAGLREALAAGGVSELGLADVGLREALRVAIVEGGAVRAAALRVPVPGAVPSPSTLDAVRSLYGVPPRVFAELGALYDELVRTSAAQLEAWRGTTLGGWLVERGVEPVVAAAMRRSAALLGALDPAAASLPALAVRARWLAPDAKPSHLAPADNPVAGARGVVQALVDALIEAGGELRLGTRAVGMHLERDRFRALAVQREEHPFLEELVAERCVLALPWSAMAELVPVPTLPQVVAAPDPDRVALAVAWAFREPPPDVPPAAGPRAVVRLLGPASAAATRPVAPGVPSAPVTLLWPTVYAPRIAPPGHALLVARTALAAPDARDLGELAGIALLVRSAVYDLFPGAQELIAWERRWVGRDAGADPLVLPSLPASLPGCDGVLLAGSTVGAPGAYASGVTAAALSGRAAAERILARATPDAHVA